MNLEEFMRTVTTSRSVVSQLTFFGLGKRKSEKSEKSEKKATKSQSKQSASIFIKSDPVPTCSIRNL
jgi:hypothetical protein